MPRSQYGNGTENWNRKTESGVTRWVHKNYPGMQVILTNNVNPATIKDYKYLIIHWHPASRGTFIQQPFERTKTMAEAMKKVKTHLKHWNNPFLWSSDPDFGKRGKQG